MLYIENNREIKTKKNFVSALSSVVTGYISSWFFVFWLLQFMYFLLLCLVLVVNIFLNLEKRCCKLNKLKWKEKEKRHEKNIKRRKEKQSIINNNFNHTDIRRLANVCRNRSMKENSHNGYFATFSMPNRRKMIIKF